MVQEVSLLIKADSLASVAETGVYCQGALLPQRGRKKQLLEVLPEDLDRFNVSLLLRFLDDFVGNGRVKKALERIFHGSAYLLREQL